MFPPCLAPLPMRYAMGVTSSDSQTRVLDVLARQAEETLSFYEDCQPMALNRRPDQRRSGGMRALFAAAR